MKKSIMRSCQLQGSMFQTLSTMSTVRMPAISQPTPFHGKYVRDTVFRVHDPRNEHGMCLVRIEQSYFHPAARKHWAKIERDFGCLLLIRTGAA